MLRRKSRVRKRTRLCTQHRKIGSWISTDHNRRDAPPVDKGHARILRVLHHVLVSQHVAVGRHHYSRPGAAAITCRFARSADVDADYRSPDVLNGAYYCL